MHILKSKLFPTIVASALLVLFGGSPAVAAAPVTADDAYSVMAGTTFTVAAPGVLANDTGLAAGMGVHWQTLPPAGFTLNTDGSITYVVPKAASGTATFSYCILDLPGSSQAQCISNLATVTVHAVTGVPPSTSPSSSASADTGGSGAGLPTTGPQVSVLAAAGLVLIAVGAMALALARRRRAKTLTP